MSSSSSDSEEQPNDQSEETSTLHASPYAPRRIPYEFRELDQQFLHKVMRIMICFLAVFVFAFSKWMSPSVAKDEKKPIFPSSPEENIDSFAQEIASVLAEARSWEQENEMIEENLLVSKILAGNVTKKIPKSQKLPEWFEKRYYERRYPGISRIEELPMCIVATGRNNMESNRQKRFLESVLNLDYSSYKLVYVDDKSEDGTLDCMKNFILDNMEAIDGRW